LADSGNIDVPAREIGGRIEDQSAENTDFQHSSAAPVSSTCPYSPRTAGRCRNIMLNVRNRMSISSYLVRTTAANQPGL
jgi:hypothetical protein